MAKPKQVTVTIANGDTTSEAVRKEQYTLAGVITPAALTGTALAVHAAATFGGTYVPVYDSDGNAVSIAIGTSRFVGVSAAEADAIAAAPFMKLVSNQTELGDRSLVLCFA